MNNFTFAGFTWPRAVAMLPEGALARRISRMRRPLTGPYCHAPEPRTPGEQAKFFYLDSEFMPGLRWRWCDEVVKSIRHTGWFYNDIHDEKIRGLVMQLPHGRGYLAGWSMGKGMASLLDLSVYPDAIGAAQAADDMAHYAAEREYFDSEDEEQSD
jgi:hypothetical protein